MNGNDLIGYLKKEVAENEFIKYLSRLKYNDNLSNSSVIYFDAPNIFIANWIKTNYVETMQRIAELKRNVKVTIEININSDKSQQKIGKGKKHVIKSNQTMLSQSFVFDNFIVGESNYFTFTICKQVSQSQAKIYNPVLIHGGTGLGKTHLLNAIGNFVLERNPNARVVYITAEMFLNDFLKRLSNNTVDIFRERYRNCDYLLIDDVQFFSGKEKIQEEFFHTFNELLSSQRQIVMTSDRPPKSITGLTDRLRSRFEGGMNTHIYPPELDTKIQIIKQKCVLNKIKIDDEIISYIAANISENIRQIEGIITKLHGQSTILGDDINMKMAINAIKDINKQNTDCITLDKILQIIAKEMNIKPSEIKSKSKTRTASMARKIAIYIARTVTINSMPDIAKELNMKDHSSISKQMKTITKEINESEDIRMMVDELISKVKSIK